MYNYMQTFLNYTFLGNSVLRYLIALGILIAGFLAIKLIVRKLIKRVEKLGSKKPGDFDDFLVSLLETVALPLLYFVVVYAALKSLAFAQAIEKAFNYLVLGAFVFFGVKVAVAFIGYGFKIYLRRRGADLELLRSLQGILMVLRVVIWSGAIIFFLDNLGFKVSALIAGLGIGGIAVALAAQSIFKDLFSYFFILFDRPFKVGDFIVIDDYMGAIENIGLKTTRLRSLTGEMLIFPNSHLTDSRIRNYKLMQKRRVEFKINVDYATELGQLKEIPKMIEKIIGSIKDASLERAHLAEFANYGLSYSIAYYVLNEDYNKYMDIQQQINLSIIEEFSKRNIHFAYPGKICLPQEPPRGKN